MVYLRYFPSLLLPFIAVFHGRIAAVNDFQLTPSFQRPKFYCNRIPLSYCCIPRVRQFCAQKCAAIECNFRIIREGDGRSFTTAFTALPDPSVRLPRPPPFLPHLPSSGERRISSVRRPAPEFLNRPDPADNIPARGNGRHQVDSAARDGTSAPIAFSSNASPPSSTARSPASGDQELKSIVDRLAALITGTSTTTLAAPTTTMTRTFATFAPDGRTTIRTAGSSEHVQQNLSVKRPRHRAVLSPPQVLGAIDELTMFAEKNVDLDVEADQSPSKSDRPNFSLPPAPPLILPQETTPPATTTTMPVIASSWPPIETNNRHAILTGARDKEWRTVEGIVEHQGQLVDSDAGKDVIVRIIAMGRRHDRTSTSPEHRLSHTAITTSTSLPMSFLATTTTHHFEITPPHPPSAQSLPTRLMRFMTPRTPEAKEIPEPPKNACGVAPDYLPCISSEIASRRLLQCCQARGLSAGCQRLCRYDVTQAEVKASFESNQCGVLNVAPFLECASGGNNNVECCRTKGVNVKGGPQCEVFCNPGNGVGALGLQHIACGAVVQEMLQCHHAGIRHSFERW